MKNRRKGLTVIEVLVIIAIVAILAAILFPVFAKARQIARHEQGSRICRCRCECCESRGTHYLPD